ncbi:MAG: hydrogenase 4 subunit F [Cyanobacteria bacterium HKST-UBA04]|nr:hydrogenase 4 subunit F [Cyanobacteria bacterium HKST-UBA04]
MQFLTLLFTLPAVNALLGLLWPGHRRWLGPLQTIGSAVLFAVTVGLAHHIVTVGPISLWQGSIYVDALSGIILLIIGGVGTLAALYGAGYMIADLDANAPTTAPATSAESNRPPRRLRFYYLLFNLFVLTMLAMAISGNMGMFWMAIEGSTMFSAFLVGYYTKKAPLEAAWKYVILCTVGIAFALIGIVLTYYAVLKAQGNLAQGLNWLYLYKLAPKLDPHLIKVAFVFILVGFGTKAGLAPIHNWLPDAHSESPTPISAMLSCVLLNCALLGIIRYVLLTQLVIDPAFAQHLLLFFGLLSLGLAVPFILVQQNIKRLLAYSSMEHIGLILIGLGLGSPLAVLGGLFHMVNHAAIKALMFFGAGNLAQRFQSKQTTHIQGAFGIMPLTSTLLLLGVLALCGSPPFSVFLSEFYILQGGLANGHWIVSGLTLLFLIIIFGGFLHTYLGIVMGTAPAGHHDNPLPKGETNPAGLLAMGCSLVLLLAMTWWLPKDLNSLLHSATDFIVQGKGLGL